MWNTAHKQGDAAIRYKVFPVQPSREVAPNGEEYHTRMKVEV
jgi:hypothetical protein